MTSESGWLIPQDWDGETWTCWSIAWPDSVEYRRLLTGLLYTLTRGRSYDRDSGTIIDAQRVGFSIFDRNNPLVGCAGESAGNGVLDAIMARGGDSATALIDEDENMLYVNVEKNELVYVCGCKEYRFPLATETGLEVRENSDGSTTATIVPTVPDALGLDYSECGMAETLINRIYAVGEAIWNNRLTPWNLGSAVQAANPGYSFSMALVSTAYAGALVLAGFESVGDLDLFNSESKREWKCYLAGLIDGDIGQEELLSKSEWYSFVLWPQTYALFGEWPDAGVLFDEAWATYWGMICDIIGRHRAAQIMYEAIGVTGDCSGCGTGPTPPITTTEPTLSGWVLGPVIDNFDVVHTDYWTTRHLTVSADYDLFGLVFDVVKGSDPAQAKTDSSDSNDPETPLSDPIWTGTSANMPAGINYVMQANDAPCDELFGVGNYVKVGSVFNSSNPASPDVTQGETGNLVFTIGGEATTGATVRYANIRPIYNVLSPDGP